MPSKLRKRFCCKITNDKTRFIFNRMNISPLLYVFKSCILALAFLIPSPGFSQNRQSSRIHLEGFSIKTDVLSLLNSAISGSLKSCSISGEIYFNNEYSFNVDLGTESGSQPGLNRREKRFGSHLRWYFMQDDCSCSAFFTGIYFSSVYTRQTVDQQDPGNNAIKSVDRNKSSFQGGLCGGYQAILARHFVIDPAVQLGLEFYRGNQSTESMNGLPEAQEKGLLLVRIMLGIGYRF